MNIKENIKGIAHLGIIVSDIDRAVCFYTENFKFRLIHRKFVIDPVSGSMEAAFVQLRDMTLELYKPTGMEEEIKNREVGILDHFAIDTADVQCAYGYLSKKGLRLHESTKNGVVDYAHIGKQGVLGVNFQGCGKEVVELCQDKSKAYHIPAGLLGWSHLAIKVHHLARSVAFYEGLGFQKCTDGYLDTPSGRLLIGFVSLKGFLLELIQVCGDLTDDLDKRGAGAIDHFALEVCNVQDAFYEMKKGGYKILQPVVKELSLFEHGVAYFTIIGPDGELVELNQKKKW